ncbi:RAB6A-GEF complex partner protein 2-like [Lingula anatina]|uniref:RAB6A-GEF complex partner protein 2-like n=1 Tax=Lingula anatina TaxID=7574 RepID=A0A1S3HY16_LINAN|nr:RAB6A-GEF complex partner protein 2-like [Lingula anatina]|eukprot:XP_013390903.1 RAB6A-GEF complex partner protein 2-like [Lingula anatina]
MVDVGNVINFPGERGLTVWSSKPKILFCDLRLGPGEQKTYLYKEGIPKDVPPSFKGQSVKYSYKLTIGTQKLECPARLLRVPFRVLVLYGLNDLNVYASGEEVTPSNPFLEQRPPENTLLEVALQVLSTVTAKRSPHCFNITNARGKVARLCMFKQAFKIGEDIVGTFDFSDASIPCVQFSATLQSEEQISEECRKKPGQLPITMSYCKHQDFCLHSRKTHFSLPIPLSASPGFISDIVTLKWKIHFEFITSQNAIPPHAAPSNPAECSTWRGPENLEVETMVWDLPIKVFPTNPLHASNVSLLKTSSMVEM